MDPLIQVNQKLYPVEIKLTATLTLKHLEPLNRFTALAGSDAAKVGVIVCRITAKTNLPNNKAIPWHEFFGWLHELGS